MREPSLSSKQKKLREDLRQDTRPPPFASERGKKDAPPSTKKKVEIEAPVE